MPASTLSNPLRRVIFSNTVGIDRIEADVEPMKSGILKLLSLFRQQ